MSDTVIMDAFKALLKPIITEALQEAGAVTDTQSAAMPAVTQTSTAAPDDLTTTDTSEDIKALYYTVEEVKTKLHVGTTTVYNLFKRRKLTKYKILGKTMILRTELDNAVDAQEICRYSHKK